MICPKCGTENRNANALCFRCGAPLHAEAETETLEDLEVENPDVETEEKPKKIGFFARLFGRWKKEDEYDEYDDFDFEGDAKGTLDGLPGQATHGAQTLTVGDVVVIIDDIKIGRAHV